MTALAVAGPPDATTTIRAKSGLGIGDADSKAARLAGGDDAANIAKLPELLRESQSSRRGTQSRKTIRQLFSGPRLP
jgi:hypothetical protein